MPTTLETEVTISIAAPPSEVWNAITTPAEIKQWFFGVDTDTDWKVGSEIVHTGEWQGKPYEDKGRVVAFEPERMLVHTHWSPLSGLADEEENYQIVTWMLSEKEDSTELTVSESNIPSEETKDVSEKSWRTALNALKELLESDREKAGRRQR